MQIPRTVFVTGATGNQGGAVVRNLLNKGIHIRALTRDPSTDRARQLAQQGVEVITGNLDEPSGFREHVRGADALFSVQSQSKGKQREIQQGIDLANIASEMGVSHLVYTSVAGAHMNTGIPHFDSKLVIEEHIKSIGIPYTILRPASLFENFLMPQVKSRVYKGKLVTPLAPATIQQMVASEDVGQNDRECIDEPGALFIQDNFSGGRTNEFNAGGPGFFRGDG